MPEERQEHHITCIECPVGCSLLAVRKPEGITVTGNRCKRGESYAVQELENPTRVLTTTVWVENGVHPLLPVRSARPLPRHLVPEGVRLLAGIRMSAPVRVGETVCGNIAGSGVAVIATRSMEALHG
ncbi:MAG TPA: DUF1667 domain-containing protein [Thermoplasmatales archaeon]|nr:DUF1667 domain-containing protein [Thermoplasmatales archaeon]